MGRQYDVILYLYDSDNPEILNIELYKPSLMLKSSRPVPKMIPATLARVLAFSSATVREPYVYPPHLSDIQERPATKTETLVVPPVPKKDSIHELIEQVQTAVHISMNRSS